MRAFTITWKIIGGDRYEQEFRGYECQGDAIDDWIEQNDIDLSEIERVDIEEK
jgi:hypothetical protein